MPLEENPFLNKRDLNEAAKLFNQVLHQQREALHLQLGTLRSEEPLSDEGLQNAREQFYTLEQAYLANIDVDESAELARLFEPAFQFLVSRERYGEKHNFTIKLLHNSFVKDKKDDRFYKAFFRYVAEKLEQGDIMASREYHAVTLKAREFLVNRRRREIFWADKVDMGAVTQVQTEFWEILGLWKQQGNVDSQDRVLYELGQIATELEDYAEAVRVHRESIAMGTLPGIDPVSTIVAEIKMHEAMAKGRTDGEQVQDPSMIVDSMLAIEQRLLAEAEGGHATAQQWVKSYYFHLGELYEAIDDRENAIASYQKVLAEPYREQEERINSTVYQRAEQKISELQKA